MSDQVPLEIFKIRDKNPLDIKIFLDESGTVDISQSDVVKYPIFEKQANRMFGAMWRFEEINLAKDKIDFYDQLNSTDRFIFTSNIQRQMVLDTEQSKAPVIAMLPLCSDPMVARCIKYITFFEELHNATYEHIIKNVYNNPTELRSGIKDVKQIVDCGNSISRYYDDLVMETAKYRLGLTTLHELKKKLWMAIQCMNALEGIRFMASFTQSFAFGNSQRMIGNASEIRLIANDELMHVAFTTVLIRQLPKDDPEFVAIEKECKEEVLYMFHEVVREEKEWQPYVFSKGSMIGMNEQIACAQIDYMAAKRMKSIGLEYNGPKVLENPVPWVNKWLSEAESQGANQETENTSYVLSVQNDLKKGSFKGMKLG